MWQFLKECLGDFWWFLTWGCEHYETTKACVYSKAEFVFTHSGVHALMLFTLATGLTFVLLNRLAYR